MSTTPINEAGITATFAAIFAALDSLLDRVATLESARIAAPTAPESAETGPGVAQEPGNTTERICGTCGYEGASVDCTPPDLPQSGFRYIQTTESVVAQICADVFLPEVVRAEVAAALRMYRKVQACTVDADHHFVYCGDGSTWKLAENLLAWLKEGEA